MEIKNSQCYSEWLHSLRNISFSFILTPISPTPLNTDYLSRLSYTHAGRSLGAGESHWKNGTSPSCWKETAKGDSGTSVFNLRQSPGPVAPRDGSSGPLAQPAWNISQPQPEHPLCPSTCFASPSLHFWEGRSCFSPAVEPCLESQRTVIHFFTIYRNRAYLLEE